VPTEYLAIKLVHVFVAIVALGTSAGLTTRSGYRRHH